MIRIHIRTMAASAALLASAATAALPRPSAAPAAGAPLGGPLIQGLCLLSQQAEIANAKVGLAATARLKQIADQAEAEIAAERTALQTDARALDEQRSALKPVELQQRQQALAQRVQALQQKAQQRGAEIQATRQKALGRISSEAQPVIEGAYRARGCGLLVDRAAVLGGNLANDLTSAVVQGLDARITTISFERETLPAPAAPARP